MFTQNKILANFGALRYFSVNVLPVKPSNTKKLGELKAAANSTHQRRQRSSFGSRLRSYIEAVDWTQRELAKELQVATGLVSEWCNDGRLPSRTTVIEIAQRISARATADASFDRADSVLRGADLGFILFNLLATGGYYIGDQLEDTVWDRLQDKGNTSIGPTIRVGWVHCPPLAQKNTKPGFALTLAKQLTAMLGASFAEFHFETWNELFDNLRRGEIDLIAPILAVDPGRSTLVNYSDPVGLILKHDLAISAKSTCKHIKLEDIDRLEIIRVGDGIGNHLPDYWHHNEQPVGSLPVSGKRLPPLIAKDLDEAKQLLALHAANYESEGRVLGFFVARPEAKNSVFPTTEVQLLKLPLILNPPFPIAFGVSRQQPTLLAELNRIIAGAKTSGLIFALVDSNEADLADFECESSLTKPMLVSEFLHPAGI